MKTVRSGKTGLQVSRTGMGGSERITIPIPGFKTVAQVEENVRAMEFGSLSDERMRQVDEVLRHDVAQQ